jgi:hypothetical protein
MRDFFELKLGNMTMEESEKNFLELLRYVGCIKEEKVKIKRFLSGPLEFYRDKIQFDGPKSLEETIKKSKYIYDQNQGKAVFFKS